MENDRGLNKVVIVTRETRLRGLIKKYNTVEQAEFYIKHMGADFSDYIAEEQQYNQAVEKVKRAAGNYARVQVIDREFLPNMIFGESDIVIAVGQDGLVANTMKYLDEQQLIGINPDKKRWDGVLLPFSADDIEMILTEVIQKKRKYKNVTMAKAETKDGQKMLAVNDFFIGPRTHTSARYDIWYDGKCENQSSSGIIISTGLGSTGWRKSIMAEALGILKYIEKKTEEGNFLQEMDMLQKETGFVWSEKRLMFTVIEPYPSNATKTEIVCGDISAENTLRCISKMPENGILFSDGIENDYIEFNSGTEITISIAEKQGKLVQ